MTHSFRQIRASAERAVYVAAYRSPGSTRHLAATCLPGSPTISAAACAPTADQSQSLTAIGTRPHRPTIGSAERAVGPVLLAAHLIHCPTAVNWSFPATVNAQTAIAIRQASR